MVTLFTIGKTMVECFKRLEMALCTTTDGWCPTTPTLPKMFNANINVEVFVGIQSVKYLFKYVYKGLEHVATVIADPTNEI